MAKTFNELRKRMSPERQARIRARAAALSVEMSLNELRQALQVSQEALAETLEQKQSGISKQERREDMLISTLRRFIEGLGGELDLMARFPEGDIRINQFQPGEE